MVEFGCGVVVLSPGNGVVEETGVTELPGVDDEGGTDEVGLEDEEDDGDDDDDDFGWLEDVGFNGLTTPVPPLADEESEVVLPPGVGVLLEGVVLTAGVFCVGVGVGIGVVVVVRPWRRTRGLAIGPRRWRERKKRSVVCQGCEGVAQS
jgi:hypothetical protein